MSFTSELPVKCDKWITLGTQSRNRDLCELAAVINLITPKTYAVNHVVRDSDTGNSLLVGHFNVTYPADRIELLKRISPPTMDVAYPVDLFVRRPAQVWKQRVLRGVSRAVAGDPYQLRIYVPDGFVAKPVELSDSLPPKMATDGSLLTVDFTASTGKDVEWKVYF
jgi:hypothetical protein